MAVKKVKYKHQRAGTRFDAQSKCFIGWRVDFYLDGKRQRNRCFPSKREAETYIGKQLNGKIPRLNEDELLEVFLSIRSKKIGYAKFKELWTSKN
jgi:hypothetical protein